eukprot:TRINITY_DN13825_c0_g1_i1.p3 TRINITY_DN13825_c0_g1~~TRINITY_DN13825_c0_g1_i1.p3  ORF type:complete len:146 (-),score=17.07 TRINITY_DN13825_c0_g1_i1:59-496(-)
MPSLVGSEMCIRDRFNHELIILCLGNNLFEQKLKFYWASWNCGVAATMYCFSNFVTSNLEEQLHFAEINGFELLVIFKEKIYKDKQKVILRQRKLKDKDKDKEMNLDEFINYLVKYYRPARSKANQIAIFHLHLLSQVLHVIDFQ